MLNPNLIVSLAALAVGFYATTWPERSCKKARINQHHALDDKNKFERKKKRNVSFPAEDVESSQFV